MFRTSWVHPQGDSCVYSVVYFTSIGLSSLVDGRACSRLFVNFKPRAFAAFCSQFYLLCTNNIKTSFKSMYKINI